VNIQDKAVLVKLSLSLPGNSRKDVNLTDEVKLRHSLGQKAGRWLKQLYPDEAFDPLAEITNEVRTWHYKRTLAYDEGVRLLPTAIHMDYTAKMREFRRSFEGRRDTFLARMDEWIAWARKEHNGTFNPDDYPGEEKVRDKFAFVVAYDPIPASDHFTQTISDMLGSEAAAIDNRVQLAVAEAHRELWGRLIAPVQAMVERLSKEDAKFRDSLVSNIEEIVALVPSLNMSGDPKLEAFRNEIGAILTFWKPQELRDSAVARKKVADKAADILARMSGYSLSL
jgi:hypothetical protein